MKKRKPNVSFAQVVAALFVGIIAMPVAVTALVRSQDQDGNNYVLSPNQAVRALEDRVRLRRQERLFWDAMHVYQRLLSEGVEGLTIPDINNPNTFDVFLDADSVKQLKEGLHESAPDIEEVEEPAVTEESFDDVLDWYNALPKNDQDLVNGFRNTRLCTRNPMVLRKIDGLAENCEKLLQYDAQVQAKEAIKRLQIRAGFLRDPSMGLGYRSLRERLMQLEESLQGRTLRPTDVTRPSTRLEDQPTSDTVNQ